MPRAHAETTDVAVARPWAEPIDRPFLARLALVLVQAAALCLLVYSFQIESPAFLRLLGLAFAGFVLHALLPARGGLLVFLAVSVAAILLLVGVDGGLFIISTGVTLIAVCHLPLGLWVRAVLLLVTGAALAALRVYTGQDTAWSQAWPILASMFMFRLVSYLQSREGARDEVDPAFGAAYFFMIPNAYYGLFPVVDYATFRKAERSADRFRTYDDGIAWIMRGMFHLLAFRLVYYGLDVGELFVGSFRDLMSKVASAFLMYVQVSGHFHIIAGLLHLYGFRVPRTHYLYFLPAGIADLWRRINIYWKDFMMKLVFYPSYFRLRGLGHDRAVLVATAGVFVATCLLHAYQSFWLTGVSRLAWQDVVFWGALGVLMLLGTRSELRRAGRTSRAAPPARWSATRAARTVTTLLVVAVLWSFWSAESPATWRYMWTRAPVGFATEWMLPAFLLAALFVVAGFRWDSVIPIAPANGPLPFQSLARRSAVRTSLLAACAALPVFQERLPVSVDGVMSSLKGDGLGFKQQLARLAGYYERLTIDSVPATATSWQKPAPSIDWVDSIGGYQDRDDFMVFGLRPNVHGTAWGHPFTINSRGMRDREYVVGKAIGTTRIALMGSSVVMGWGVGDGETFESIAEARLDSAARSHGRQVEILNFAVSAQPLTQQAFAAQLLAAPFGPDFYVLTAMPYLLTQQARALRQVFDKGLEVPDSGLARILQEAGVTTDTPERDIMMAIRVNEGAWYRAIFRWVVGVAAPQGSRVALLLLAEPGGSGLGSMRIIRESAEAEGVAVLDCSLIWDGRNYRELVLSDADGHANASGHRRIAECLEPQLRPLVGQPPLPTGPAR